MNTNLCEAVLKDMLTTRGFIFDKPNVQLAWDTFKKFSKVEFDNTDEGLHCVDDMLLFQSGINNYSGKTLYSWDVVRQFCFDDEDGEYDHMEQIHLTIYYPPDDMLTKIADSPTWSEEFSTLEEFFKAMEESDSFRIPLDNVAPINCSIYGHLI